MNQQEQNRIPATAENVALVTLIKVIVVIVFVYPLLHYSFLQSSDVTSQQERNDTQPPIENATIEEVVQEVALPPVKKIIEQPSCPLSYLKIVLQELCEELFLQHQQCTPADVDNLEKHKLPVRKNAANTKGEPRGTIVGCVAAGLLLTSLGAAFLELYKAKSQTPVKAKPPMNRKCSLADLTVLKHNRKELVRRESIMDIPENGGPLKPPGFRPPPLFRRSSFPVGPSEFSPYGSRRTSIESRRLSIIDSRRNSVDFFRQGSRPSSRQASIDHGRALSFDNESPERRHWSKLVHRH